MTVSRRYLLHYAVALAGGLGTIIMSAGAKAQAKASQAMVAYQPTPKEGHSCATCQYFEPPNACKVVEGPVSPAGWCNLWTQKS